MEAADQPLDVHSWLVVITFMIVIAIVIHPIRIPLPIPALSSTSSSRSQSTAQQQQQDNHKSDGAGSTLVHNPTAAITATGNNSLAVATNQRKQLKQKFPYHFTLGIASAPVLGVLFLLATRSIGGDSVRDGIVGAPESGVEPYAVMILFFSLVSRGGKKKESDRLVYIHIYYMCWNLSREGTHSPMLFPYPICFFYMFFVLPSCA